MRERSQKIKTTEQELEKQKSLKIRKKEMFFSPLSVHNFLSLILDEEVIENRF